MSLGEFEDTSVAHILNPVAFLGSISPYATRTNETNPFVIQISPGVAEGRNIVFQATLWYHGAVDTTRQQVVLTASNGQQLAGVMDSTMTLTANRIWLVNQSFRVGTNGNLTIDPGTKIVLNNLLVNKGHIMANGTPDSNIVFEGPSGLRGLGSFTFSYTQFISTNAGFGDASSYYQGSDYQFDHCKFEGISTGTNPNVWVGAMFLGPSFSFSNCIFVNCAFTVFDYANQPATFYKCNMDYCSSSLGYMVGYEPQFPGSYNNFNRLSNYNPGYHPTSIYSPTTDVTSVGNNFLGFGQSSYAVYTTGNGDIINIPNQYWGTADSAGLKGRYMISGTIRIFPW